MSSAAAFLQAIRENPEDNSLRLVCADWLEETGDPAQVVRAQVMRLQCELAAWVPDQQRRNRLHEQVRQRLQDSEAAWLGPLAGFRGHWTWELDRGLLRLALPMSRFLRRDFRRPGAELLERCGVQSLRLEEVGRSPRASELAEQP